MNLLVKSATRSIGIVTSMLLASLLWVAVAHGAGGDLLWEDTLHANNGFAMGEAVAVAGKRVFVGGIVASDFLVRAYDTKTGGLLWEDQFDGGGGQDNVVDLTTVGGKRLFVAATSEDASNNFDWMVRAYDTKTGTALWTTFFDPAGLFDIPVAIAAAGRRVFVTGQCECASGNFDLAIAAFDAKTGAVLWTAEIDGSGGIDVGFGVAAVGNRVFVAGQVENAGGGLDFFVQAYNAKTGAVLWTDQHNTGNSDAAIAIATEGKLVFVAGQTEGTGIDFTVRAYDTKTGLLRWQNEYDVAGHFDQAVSITAGKNRVFAAGSGRSEAFVPDFLVRAYDAKKGTVLWTDQFVTGNTSGSALSVAESGGFVFAAGSVQNVTGNPDFLVRAYDAKTGMVLWTDQLDRAGGSDGANGIAATEMRAFATGRDQEADTGFPGTHADFVIRAYENE